MHRLTAFMSASPESPLQTTYEGRGFGGGHPVLDQYLSQADKLVAATKSGGVTLPSTTLWHVAGQGTDLRHSDKRTHNGYDWSHKVGGKSVSGRDVSTEPKTLEEAKAQGIIKEDDR